jgi:DNA replication protein DnaC
MNSKNEIEKGSCVMSNDERAAIYYPPEPVACEFCGAPRYTKGIYQGSYYGVKWNVVPEPCTCPEAEEVEAARLAKLEVERKAEEARKLNERIREIIGESGMGERFLRRTFETFQITGENQKAANKAKKYADSFNSLMPKQGQPEPGCNGLFIVGPKGIGKTHLAAAIANRLIHQGTPVICMTMIDLLERIKRTFSRDGANEGDVIRLYKTVPLLVIDDIGKEPPTEWAVSTVYNIINGRYEAYLPTIVTTNYDNKTLIARMTPRETRDSITAEATIDRLREMCVGVIMDGQSWRSR